MAGGRSGRLNPSPSALLDADIGPTGAAAVGALAPAAGNWSGGAAVADASSPAAVPAVAGH